MRLTGPYQPKEFNMVSDGTYYWTVRAELQMLYDTDPEWRQTYIYDSAAA
jgi:hypothetical protein